MTIRLSVGEQDLIARASNVLLSPGSFGSEVDWHKSVMQALMPLTNAYKSAIRVARSSGLQMTPLGFEEAAISEYKAYYHRFDFGRALGAKPMLSEVFSRNEYYSRELSLFRRTEYYSDYLSKYRVFDALCVSTQTDQHETAIVLYLWHERDLSAEKRRKSVAMLRLLAPSFRAGMSIGLQLHGRKRDFLQQIDSCPEGYALFSNTGVLLHRNPALILALAEAEDADLLSNAIVQAVLGVRETHVAHSCSPEGMARVATIHRDAGCGYALSACAFDIGASEGPSILVTVTPTSPAGASSIDSAQLRSQFDLTQREIEVAVLLRDRRTNHEISQRLGVSEHTARHHTENVMRKLGVRARTGVSRVLRDSPRLRQ